MSHTVKSLMVLTKNFARAVAGYSVAEEGEITAAGKTVDLTQKILENALTAVAAERDQLRARVAELEARQPAVEEDLKMVWECNECGAQQYTSSVKECDLHYLGCNACGGDEFHKANKKQQPAPKAAPQAATDLTDVQMCCGDYAKCHRPCTPRGRWLALREALAAPVVPSGYAPVPVGAVRAEAGFLFDGMKQEHIPTLVVEFAPVAVGDPDGGQAKGWKDRDALLALVVAALKPKEPT